MCSSIRLAHQAVYRKIGNFYNSTYVIIPSSQQMASQMQQANPELVENLRQQMRAQESNKGKQSKCKNLFCFQEK